MYARSALLSMTDEQVDELVVMFEKEMGPLHAETPGFAGLMLVADRLHQLAFGVSFWKTKEDRERTGKLGRALLDRVNEIAGRESSRYQFWEVLYSDIRKGMPASTRSILETVGPEHYEDLLSMIVYDMGPRYADVRGYTGLVAMVDPDARQVFGFSFWKTEENRDDSSELGRRLRRKVNEIGGLHNPAFQTWDVVYYHVPEPGLVLRSGWIVEDGLLIDTTMPAGSAPPPQVAG
jgi:heme-degrading monooxygenase HmoA